MFKYRNKYNDEINIMKFSPIKHKRDIEPTEASVFFCFERQIKIRTTFYKVYKF